jgi:hypothetical protein
VRKRKTGDGKLFGKVKGAPKKLPTVRSDQESGLRVQRRRRVEKSGEGRRGGDSRG